jgi:DNA-directed RNA polymerase III subunit RPC1
LRDKWIKALREHGLEPGRREVIMRNVWRECKKPKMCPHCSSYNGTVKKIGLKIYHDKYSDKNGEELEDLQEKMDFMLQQEKDIPINTKLMEELNPLVALRLCEKVSTEDIELMGMKETISHPKDLFLTHLLVPPVCIRPSVQVSQGMSNEDDLTVKLQEVVQLNSILKHSIAEGLQLNKVMQEWEYLQAVVAQYINADTSGLPPALATGKAIRALVQRLKGKHGRFRGNLSGKRVDFSGRTVISPDPNSPIYEVVVPIHMAKVLTFPERVCNSNIEVLRQAVVRGPNAHPGANLIQLKDGSRISLYFGKREEAARALMPGDMVERHLRDGDMVLFNRQPSLHRISIMAHSAKILPGRTLRFNECVCTPYNADFDGDEMNIHLPQTEEARAEAKELMAVHKNLLTPKSGAPIIALTQDFLTTGYLITCTDCFMDRSAFFKYLSSSVDMTKPVQIPKPAIVKPRELWTGKQLVSVILKSCTKYPLTVDIKEKHYGGTGGVMSNDDGFICLFRSELVAGTLAKISLGSGSKAGIIFSIIKESSDLDASKFMLYMAKLSGRWLSERGFTVGLQDVTPPPKLLGAKAEVISKGINQCGDQIALWKAGELPLKPGCNAEQTLEQVLNGLLSNVRNQLGTICKDSLPYDNTPLVMAISGSKGSDINLCQMIACVGQQTVSGHRIPDGFRDRTLPHFPKGARAPNAKGFVSNSFYSGLTPSEFFFHTMGGREGLVDTAVKTAETGYMQRRLMKTLEDLAIKYDYSVRTSSDEVVQFLYGDDGLEPMQMEEGVINLPKLLTNVRAGHVKDSLSGEEILKAVDSYQTFKFPGVHIFSAQLREFLQKHVSDMDKKEATERVKEYLYGISDQEMQQFLFRCWDKYRKAVVNPGEAVGAVAAQSIGEPGTQMTLKTFHFAGVASMNITLGVPRIKEIINAVKDISTPIITANLLNNQELISARAVKGRLEKTHLGDVCKYIEEVFGNNGCYLRVKLDLETIESLKLELNAELVKVALLEKGKLKLKEKHILVEGKDSLRIDSPESSREKLYFSLQELKTKLPRVMISGIPTISRAIINKDNNKYILLIEGSGLRDVMRTPGVDHKKCTTNHILEAEEVLGVEAARSTIINEIKYTLSEHGIAVDSRHLALVADVMTTKGTVLGITRFGLAKMKQSALMLASFEKTADHLFDAAISGNLDSITGVSECIILGKTVPLGTGMIPKRRPIIWN